MKEYIVKLTDDQYLVNRNNSSDRLIDAKVYKNKRTAKKVAKGHRQVPWYKDAKVVRLTTEISGLGRVTFSTDGQTND